RRRVERFGSILNSLLVDSGTPKVTLQVSQQQDDSIAAACRHAWVAVGSQPQQHLDFTHRGPTDRVRPMELQGDLKIEVTMLEDPTGEKCNHGDQYLIWGPLDLLRRHLAKADRRQNGRFWVVP